MRCPENGLASLTESGRCRVDDVNVRKFGPKSLKIGSEMRTSASMVGDLYGRHRKYETWKDCITMKRKRPGVMSLRLKVGWTLNKYRHESKIPS